jgi:hypothetical protein
VERSDTRGYRLTKIRTPAGVLGFPGTPAGVPSGTHASGVRRALIDRPYSLPRGYTEWLTRLIKEPDLA